MISTEAWVLYAGSKDNDASAKRFVLEPFSFQYIKPSEVLVEPLYGCWEANMSHAINRSPVDICHQRKEERIVLGNGGVVRVLEVGSEVKSCHEGDICFLLPFGRVDELGYVKTIHAYDEPHTVGLLSKQVKVEGTRLMKVPTTEYSLLQWSTYVRYWTAWSNWKIAYACWKSQVDDETKPIVWGWGGGTTLAQLELAKKFGADTVMIASNEKRIREINSKGIKALNRQQFPLLHFDAQEYSVNSEYRANYQKSEKSFLEAVSDLTNGRGVSIFIDNIGTPVYRATLKALGRQGVITTCGWKHGMELKTYRAIECITRHIHVHTHFCRFTEVADIVEFQNKAGWLPGHTEQVYSWKDIEKLSRDYDAGKIDSYFPVYQVNG